MKRIGNDPYYWVYLLASGFLFLGCLMRSLLLYQQAEQLLGIVLLGVWQGLFVLEMFITRLWRAFFFLYLLIQTALIFFLCATMSDPDFFAILYAILSMQILRFTTLRIGLPVILSFTVLTGFSMSHVYGWDKIVPICVLYLAANALLGSFAYISRQTVEEHERNERLLHELEIANAQLRSYASEIEQGSIVRERNRLARELHDSVTQTIFSMTLVTQSTRLLMRKDPASIPAQLERLNELGRSAQAEMNQLITQLKPVKLTTPDLAKRIRQHARGLVLPAGLSVTVEATGKGSLRQAEEQALFRITQEALNNVIKHSGAKHATVHLRLAEPGLLEIEDDGKGFEMEGSEFQAGVGIASMQERAEGIGWRLVVHSEPSTGTLVRAEKKSRQKKVKHEKDQDPDRR